MIELVRGAAAEREYQARIAGRPFFGAAMGLHYELFSEKPGSGWAFYRMPGAVLALRGISGSVCGTPEDPEELAQFLRFTGVERVTCTGAGPLGWRQRRALKLFTLPAGQALPLPAQPAGLRLEKQPALLPLCELLFADDEEHRSRFYSDTCTAAARGCAEVWALYRGDAPVCTVGSYAIWQGEAYMAAGETLEVLRGRGIGGWLILAMANEMAARGLSVTLLCEEKRVHFYNRLGFIQNGEYYQYSTNSSKSE